MLHYINDLFTAISKINVIKSNVTCIKWQSIFILSKIILSIVIISKVIISIAIVSFVNYKERKYFEIGP